MSSMTVKILKNGNIITEMNGFVGETCVTKAEEVMAKLKEKGIIVNVDTFHQKSADCPDTLVHVAEKVGK